MLTPEYLDGLTDDILAMYDALNESIIGDVARRIVKTGMVTETADETGAGNGRSVRGCH